MMRMQKKFYAQAATLADIGEIVMKMKANKKRPLRKWLCDCPKCGRAVTYREDDVWLCRCDCGREVLVRGEDLRSGKVTSCGFCDASQNDK